MGEITEVFEDPIWKHTTLPVTHISQRVRTGEMLASKIPHVSNNIENSRLILQSKLRIKPWKP